MGFAPPWSDPAGYIANLSVLLTAGAIKLMAPVSIDTTAMMTGSSAASVVLGCLFGLPTFAYIIYRLRSEAALFFAGFALLFAIPQASSSPADRLLFCAALGSATLLAMFIAEVWAQQRIGRASRFDGALAMTLLILAGPLSAIATLGHSAAISMTARETNSSVLRTDVGDPSLGHRRLILMQAANSLLPGSLGPVWRRESTDLALRLETLHTAARAFEWKREGERERQRQKERGGGCPWSRSVSCRWKRSTCRRWSSGCARSRTPG
jgi:hypothetical protein